MAVDMAFELRKTNVACVSLWPGAVMTENIHDIIHCQSKNEMVKKANYLSFRTYGVLSKFLSESYLTIIPRARMGYESIAYEAEGRVDY